jgi:hypothetical protein
MKRKDGGGGVLRLHRCSGKDKQVTSDQIVLAG